MKAGWKTTEFWITICTSLGAWALEVKDYIPLKYAFAFSILSTTAYQISRGLAKGKHRYTKLELPRKTKKSKKIVS